MDKSDLSEAAATVSMQLNGVRRSCCCPVFMRLTQTLPSGPGGVHLSVFKSPRPNSSILSQCLSRALFLSDRLMAGGSLANELERRGGRLSEAEAKQVAWRILEGLASMHAGGYAHLDIKPANVGIEAKGDVRTAAVMDFGLAEPTGAATSSPIP